jgi:hypothetical protein
VKVNRNWSQIAKLKRVTGHHSLESTDLEGRVPGRRGRGRLKRRWIQDINETLNMTTTEVNNLARDRTGLRGAVKRATFCKGHTYIW